MSGAGAVESEWLSGARERFLESGAVDGTSARSTILASWRRSQFWGVPVDELAPPFRPDTETDGRLMHAARPVLDRLEAALAGAPMSVILTDAHAFVLDRRAGELSLNKHLDLILLAPGFSYAEQFVGTNGIGSALEARQSFRVFGSEHFSERLQQMSCAGTPIRNLLNGRVEGVIDLTSWRADANPLMQALSQEAAAEIEQLLVQQSSERQQAVLREFLAVNRRSARAVLALSDDLFMTNDVADRTLGRDDRLILRERAAGVMSGSHDTSGEVVLAEGRRARIRCRAVTGPTGSAGAIIEVTLGEAAPRPRTTGTLSTAPLPDLAGTSLVWVEASKRVEAHCRERSWLLVAGESGVGKLALVQAAHRRWYPTRHLIVLDAVELTDDVESRLERLLDLENVPCTLVLRHLDHMSGAAIGQLDAVLQLVDRSPRGPWVVGTVHSDTDPEDRLGKLLRHFTESVPVPPLRHRIEDVRELVPHFLQRHAPGRRIGVAPDAMQTLLRGGWPGNVAELEQAVRSALGRRHTGQITVADLPGSCHATSRRVLSEWERIECDAIIRALKACNGDKIRAAVQLGISRATIYRKIRTFGITESEGPPGQAT